MGVGWEGIGTTLHSLPAPDLNHCPLDGWHVLQPVLDTGSVGADWVKRKYEPAEDADALVFLWCRSYHRSREGIARGAYVPSSRFRGTLTQSEIHRQRLAQRALWNEQAPLVEWILANADVEVVCDPTRVRASDAGPSVIWGFAATDGDVVHYVLVKRDIAIAGYGPDIVRDLLGDRLGRACRYTHELVELRGHASGVEQPRSWTFDPMYLPRRIVGHRATEAA